MDRVLVIKLGLRTPDELYSTKVSRTIVVDEKFSTIDLIELLETLQNLVNAMIATRD